MLTPNNIVKRLRSLEHGQLKQVHCAAQVSYQTLLRLRSGKTQAINMKACTYQKLANYFEKMDETC